MKISAFYITNPRSSIEWIATVIDNDTIISTESSYPNGDCYFDIQNTYYLELSRFKRNDDIITELWSIEL